MDGQTVKARIRTGRARLARGDRRRFLSVAGSIGLATVAIVWLSGLETGGAGERVSAGRRNRPFQIGYVRPEAKEPMSPMWFQKLTQSLETDPFNDQLRERLAAESYNGIRLVAAEGFHDLVDRMKARRAELDVAFCPAVAYCQVIKDVAADPTRSVLEKALPYRVVFQLRGPHNRGRERHLLQNGVIFVNARHLLFQAPDPVPREIIAAHFTSEPVALVSRYSAPGYYYPCVALAPPSPARQAGSPPPVLPTQPVFCGSSEEVVKMVLSDMVGMGACEEGALDDILKRYEGRLRPDQIVHKLKRTDGSPADPIVFHESLSLEANREIHRLLKAALRKFFLSENRPAGYSLEESEQEDFEDAFADLGEVLAMFDRMESARREAP